MELTKKQRSRLIQAKLKRYLLLIKNNTITNQQKLRTLFYRHCVERQRPYFIVERPSRSQNYLSVIIDFGPLIDDISPGLSQAINDALRHYLPHIKPQSITYLKGDYRGLVYLKSAHAMPLARELVRLTKTQVD